MSNSTLPSSHHWQQNKDGCPGWTGNAEQMETVVSHFVLFAVNLDVALSYATLPVTATD